MVDGVDIEKVEALSFAARSCYAKDATKFATASVGIQVEADLSLKKNCK